MENLQILSLGRNLVKKIEGLEPVADTLEELWLSYNQIDKLVGGPGARRGASAARAAAGALHLQGAPWRWAARRLPPAACRLPPAACRASSRARPPARPPARSPAWSAAASCACCTSPTTASRTTPSWTGWRRWAPWRTCCWCAGRHQGSGLWAQGLGLHRVGTIAVGCAGLLAGCCGRLSWLSWLSLLLVLLVLVLQVGNPLYTDNAKDAQGLAAYRVEVGGSMQQRAAALRCTCSAGGGRLLSARGLAAARRSSGACRSSRSWTAYPWTWTSASRRRRASEEGVVRWWRWWRGVEGTGAPETRVARKPPRPPARADVRPARRCVANAQRTQPRAPRTPTTSPEPLDAPRASPPQRRCQ
jgi:hypothetical protein